MESLSWGGVLATGRWYSGFLHHKLTEILLKVVFNTINQAKHNPTRNHQNIWIWSETIKPFWLAYEIYNIIIISCFYTIICRLIIILHLSLDSFDSGGRILISLKSRAICIKLELYMPCTLLSSPWSLHVPVNIM